MGVRVTDLSVGAPPAAEAPPCVFQVLREAFVVWTRRKRGVKLVRKIVTRQRSCARSTGGNIWRPPWGRIKGDSQPQFKFVGVLVFCVRLLIVAVGFQGFTVRLEYL